MKVVGFFSTFLFLGALVVVLDFYLPGSYLDSFLSNNFVEAFAALIGFNFAAVVFLLGQIASVERELKVEGDSFSKTKREIRHNAYFMLFSFVFSIIVLVVRPDLNETLSFVGNQGYYVLNVVVLALFGLGVFAIYEILRSAFSLHSHKSGIGQRKVD